MGQSSNIQAGLMGGSSLIQGGAALSGSIMQAGAQKAQGEYQRQQYDFNAAIAEVQAADAIKRGEKDAQTVRKQGKRTIGAQRAALAAQGVDVNSGSAADLQNETAELSAMDAMTIENNAWREAWGFKVQANDYQGRGKFAQMAGNNAAGSTLLTGGMSFASYGAQGAGYLSGLRKKG